jgi:hypothetical protein
MASDADALEFVWRLTQMLYNSSSSYGPAAARFGNVALGVPGNLFSHGLANGHDRALGALYALSRRIFR